MKNTTSLRLESITRDKSRSFSLLFDPKLSDLYLWHFHPEYELVYIEADHGRRQIGDHISTYVDGDLVLIGSGIPHLNFDYGIKDAYRKVVLHLKKELVEGHLMEVPELHKTKDLFLRSRQVVVFKGEQKKRLGKRLFDFESKPSSEQYLLIIRLLEDLAKEQQFDLLFDQPYVAGINDKELNRMNMIHRYIDENYNSSITISDMASLVNMSREAFCRYFKTTTDYTFIQFLHRYRVSQAKLMMMEGKSISEACYACGFESLSYFNRVFKKITALNPRDFKASL